VLLLLGLIPGCVALLIGGFILYLVVRGRRLRRECQQWAATAQALQLRLSQLSSAKPTDPFDSGFDLRSGRLPCPGLARQPMRGFHQGVPVQVFATRNRTSGSITSWEYTHAWAWFPRPLGIGLNVMSRDPSEAFVQQVVGADGIVVGDARFDQKFRTAASNTQYATWLLQQLARDLVAGAERARALRLDDERVEVSAWGCEATLAHVQPPLDLAVWVARRVVAVAGQAGMQRA